MIKFDKEDDILDKDLNDLMSVNQDDIESVNNQRANFFNNLLYGYYGIRTLWFFICLGFLVIALLSPYANSTIKYFIVIPFVLIPYTLAAVILIWHCANRINNPVLLISTPVLYIIYTLLASIFVIVNII